MIPLEIPLVPMVISMVPFALPSTIGKQMVPLGEPERSLWFCDGMEVFIRIIIIVKLKPSDTILKVKLQHRP